MRFNSFLFKLLIIFSFLGLILLYAQYEKSKYYSNSDSQDSNQVLKSLPAFEIKDVQSSALITSNQFKSKHRGLFVHLWGTWCGPCEKEMPEFLAYAEKLKEKNIQFLLVAVNDDEVKIKKFLTRFKSIPSNVIIGLDLNNKVMDLFGTLKVPETFLFDGNGKHINKFVGPQEWGQGSYISRLDFWLNGQGFEKRAIETH